MITPVFQKLYSLIYNGTQKVSYNEELEILPDVVFLVSYPRSGNTWLRFILANLLHKDADITFTNIHRYCPEMGKSKRFSSRMRKARLIKSHDPFNPSFPRVVYVVRDGRDVYVSYYHYLKNKFSSGMSFRDFLKDGQMPHGRWGDHILSWLDNYVDKPLLVIKYEDIYLNSIRTIQKVVEFIDLEADDASIKSALGKSTFDRMKEIEVRYGRGKYKTGPDTFMRKGEIGDWRNYFGEDEMTIFKEKEKEALVRLQYEKDSNW